MTIVGGQVENKSLGIPIMMGRGTFTNVEIVDGYLVLKRDQDSFYLGTGQWLSETINVGDAFKQYENVIVSDIKSVNTSIELYTRVSSNGVSFTSWVKVDADNKIMSEMRRYIQIRIDFKSDTIELSKSLNFTNYSKELFINVSPSSPTVASVSNTTTTNANLSQRLNATSGSIHAVDFKKSQIARFDRMTPTNAIAGETALVYNGGVYKRWIPEKQANPLQYANIAPTELTSNAISGGNLVYNVEFSNQRAAYRAFDGRISDINTSWASVNTNFPHYIGFNYASQYYIPARYSIANATDSPAGAYPTAWDFQGSLANGSWVTLDSRSGESFSNGQQKYYTVNTSDAYRGFRILITANGRISKSTIVSLFTVDIKTSDESPYVPPHWSNVTVSQSSPQNAFSSLGNSDYSELYARSSSGITPLDLLSGDFEINVWSPTNNLTTRDFIVQGLAISPTLQSDVFIGRQGILKRMVVSDNSNASNNPVRILFRGNDNLWRRWNGTSFETVSDLNTIYISGNTKTEINSINFLSSWVHGNINIAATLPVNTNNNTSTTLNNITVIEDRNVNTPQVSAVNVSILNTKAMIDIEFKSNALTATISDADSTKVQYRVLLNDNPYSPNNGNFTPLSDPEQNIDIKFKPTEILINQQNKIRVEFKDYFGTLDYWETSFIGGYPGIVFKDVNGEYYSNDLGEILKYLDFGIITAGKRSMSHEIKLANQLGYDLSNVQLITQGANFTRGLTVEISKDSTVSDANSSLEYEDGLNADQEVSFYIRLASDINAIPNGQTSFDLVVNATRKGD